MGNIPRFEDTIPAPHLRCALVIDREGAVLPFNFLAKHLPIAHKWLAERNGENYYTSSSSAVYYLGEGRVITLLVYVLNKVELTHSKLLGRDREMFPIPSDRIGYCKIRARWRKMQLSKTVESSRGTCKLFIFRSAR